MRVTDAGSEVTFGSQLPAAARHFATPAGAAKSAVFAAVWHAGRIAARGDLFRVKVAAERIFVVADSIQSLLDLFDIKAVFGAVRCRAGSLFTNSKFRTGKGYG